MYPSSITRARSILYSIVYVLVAYIIANAVPGTGMILIYYNYNAAVAVLIRC
jgi:hypothetical protein